MGLEIIEFLRDRDQRGPHIVLVSLISGAHGEWHAKDPLGHPIIHTGQHEGSGLWLLRGTLEPQIKALGAQDPLE
jgi:hypothetical protein